MGIEVSIPGSHQPATETYRVLIVNPPYCNDRFSITKTSERGPVSIQPTSLIDGNIHFKGV